MSYIKHLEIYSPKILQAKRILVLSDLHISKNSDEHINEVIDDIKGHNDIDLILMPGDIIHSTNFLDFQGSSQKLVNQMTRLTRDIPTYISAGNHDQMIREGFEKWRKSDYKRLKELLNTIKNITFLDNEVVDIGNIKIGDFTPSIDYYLTHHETPKAMLNEYKRVGPNIKFTKETFNVLLSHDPISLLKIAHSPHGNLIPKANLVLSGHTHEGLVPYGLQGKVSRGLVSPNYEPLPKYSMGTYQKGKTIYVINGAVNPFVESPIINNALGTNYTIIDLLNGPKLTYKRET